MWPALPSAAWPQRALAVPSWLPGPLPDQKPPGAAQRKLLLACLSRLIFLYHRTPLGRPARLILWNTQLSSSTSVPVGGNVHQGPAVDPSGPWPCGGQLRGIFPFLSSRKRWKHRNREQRFQLPKKNCSRTLRARDALRGPPCSDQVLRV